MTVEFWVFIQEDLGCQGRGFEEMDRSCRPSCLTAEGIARFGMAVLGRGRWVLHGGAEGFPRGVAAVVVGCMPGFHCDGRPKPVFRTHGDELYRMIEV